MVERGDRMARKRRRVKANFKRAFLITVFCLITNFFIITYIGGTFMSVIELKKEKQELSGTLVDLKEKEETLKAEVNKLQDPDYIAKYAREKFMYSGDGDYIIRIK